MNTLTDNCGNCVTVEGVVTVHPHQVIPVDGESVRACYQCPECGYRWWTSWLVGREAGRTGLAA